MSDLRDRLRRLLALANDSDSPESRTARRMLERLLAENGLDAADVLAEPRTNRSLAAPRNMWPLVDAICESLCLANPRLRIALVRSARRKGRRARIKAAAVLHVEASDREFKALRELYAFSRSCYSRQSRAKARELKSWFFGHLYGLYPCKNPLLCPKCYAAGYEFDAAQCRFVCSKCGHRSREIEPLDAESFLAGVREAARPVLAAPANPQLEAGT